MMIATETPIYIEHTMAFEAARRFASA